MEQIDGSSPFRSSAMRRHAINLRARLRAEHPPGSGNPGPLAGSPLLSRRHFLWDTAGGIGGIALAWMLDQERNSQAAAARRLLERGVRFVQLFNRGSSGSPRINRDGHENIKENHTAHIPPRLPPSSIYSGSTIRSSRSTTTASTAVSLMCMRTSSAQFSLDFSTGSWGGLICGDGEAF